MGKRSNFKRKERDFYPTPYNAVIPLIHHLKPNTMFTEPCCGNGDLVNHLSIHGHKCLYQSDIAIFGDVVGHCHDALSIAECYGDCFITNPPWEWHILNKLIVHLSNLAPTWLLLNADQMHNKRFGKHMEKCVKVVSIGRVKWEPKSKGTGMENSAWYLFDQSHAGATEFVGRGCS